MDIKFLETKEWCCEGKVWQENGDDDGEGQTGRWVTCSECNGLCWKDVPVNVIKI